MKSHKYVSIIAFAAALSMGANCLAEQYPHHDDATHNNAVIHMALKRDLPTSDISVLTNDHNLQVIGFVDTPKQMRQLLAVLEKYQETDHVYNNVKILSVHDNSKDESHLIKRVQEQLSEEKLPVEDIDIQVRNGHVIVGGFINRHVAANKVGEAIRKVPGIVKVNNYVLYKS